MKKVEGWKTTDNQVFCDEKEARKHQNKLDFIEWYGESYDRMIRTGWGDCIESEAVIDYLLQHKEQILKLLEE